MASNPLFIIPDFFFYIFQMNFAMATIGLKEMGKFLCEGREKSLPIWLSQFSSNFDSQQGRLELVSKGLNHLAAILHVYAGGLNFMK